MTGLELFYASFGITAGFGLGALCVVFVVAAIEGLLDRG